MIADLWIIIGQQCSYWNIIYLHCNLTLLSFTSCFKVSCSSSESLWTWSTLSYAWFFFAKVASSHCPLTNEELIEEWVFGTGARGWLILLPPPTLQNNAITQVKWLGSPKLDLTITKYAWECFWLNIEKANGKRSHSIDRYLCVFSAMCLLLNICTH